MRRLLAASACLLTAACFPPSHSSDYSVPFAKAYWSTPEGQRPATSSLTIEQLYALNQYGRRAFHPWRTMATTFGCRGAEAVPFLKTKITPRTVGGMLELFVWMRMMGTYEPVADPDLMARIHAAYAAQPKALRKAYAKDLAEVEGDIRQPGATGAEAAERLRKGYCERAAI
jgi:hypothetical protein